MKKMHKILSLLLAVIMACAMLAVLLTPLPRYGFLPDHHGFLSSHGLTLAAHLSPEHHFLMYNRIAVDSACCEGAVGISHLEWRDVLGAERDDGVGG